MSLMPPRKKPAGLKDGCFGYSAYCDSCGNEKEFFEASNRLCESCSSRALNRKINGMLELDYDTEMFLLRDEIESFKQPEEKMPADSEVTVELSFMKRFNLGNYQHKEYTVKIGGTQSQIEHQLGEEKQKLTNYIAQLEAIVDIANEANKLKAKIEPKAEKLQEL